MNEIIKNQATGDQIEFIQTAESTSGEISEFIMTLAPRSRWAKSPMHFHPFQTETFKVISGTLNMRVGKEKIILKAGDPKVAVDKFVPHGFWNDTDQQVSFIAEIFPPRNIEKGIRLTYALSQKGKINNRNIPYNPFYTLVLMKYFDAYFTFIPWKWQRFLFNLGASLAHFIGYK